jgi:hypothetical protein
MGGTGLEPVTPSHRLRSAAAMTWLRHLSDPHLRGISPGQTLDGLKVSVLQRGCRDHAERLPAHTRFARPTLPVGNFGLVSRQLLRRLAAALAAAAAVWTIVAAGLGGHGPVVFAALAVAFAAAGAYVALGPPPRRDALRSFGMGLAAQAGALYVVYALWVLTGCTSSTPGHIDAWMWSVGLAVIRRRRRVGAAAAPSDVVAAAGGDDPRRGGHRHARDRRQRFDGLLRELTRKRVAALFAASDGGDHRFHELVAPR